MQRSPTLLELAGTRSAHLYHWSTIWQDRRRQEEVNRRWKVEVKESRSKGIHAAVFTRRPGNTGSDAACSCAAKSLCILSFGFLCLVMLSFDVMHFGTLAVGQFRSGPVRKVIAVRVLVCKSVDSAFGLSCFLSVTLMPQPFVVHGHACRHIETSPVEVEAANRAS